MSGAGDAAQAIGGLLIGGIIFTVFGSALAGTALDGGPFVNFQFWGALYIVAAIVLAVIFVGGAVAAVFNSL